MLWMRAVILRDVAWLRRCSMSCEMLRIVMGAVMPRDVADAYCVIYGWSAWCCVTLRAVAWLRRCAITRVGRKKRAWAGLLSSLWYVFLNSNIFILFLFHTFIYPTGFMLPQVSEVIKISRYVFYYYSPYLCSISSPSPLYSFLSSLTVITSFSSFLSYYSFTLFIFSSHVLFCVGLSMCLLFHLPCYCYLSFKFTNAFISRHAVISSCFYLLRYLVIY